MDGDKAIPVFDRQHPLPNTALVQIVNHNETYNEEQALVPITTYLEEPAYIPEEGMSDLGQIPMVNFQDGQYNMDLNTLLFLAG